MMGAAASTGTSRHLEAAAEEKDLVDTTDPAVKHTLEVPQASQKEGASKKTQPSGTSYGLEEFVDYDSIPVSYGKLGTHGEDHALFKTNLVLVRDSEDVRQPIAIIYKSSDIYITGQLNIKQFLQFASEHPENSICKISLRLEPVLFIASTSETEDLISLHLYNVRDEKAFSPMDMKVGESCQNYEVQVRKELSTLATQMKGFQYYNTNSTQENLPIAFSMLGDEDLLTLTEVDAELSLFSCTSCIRVAFPYEGLPKLTDVDALVAAVKDLKADIFLIEDGDITHPRCQFAICILLIVQGYCQEITPQDRVSPLFINHAAEALVEHLDTKTCRYKVDQLLTTIATFTGVTIIQDILTALSNNWQGGNCNMDSKSNKEVQVTQMYLMLIIFNHYWSQAPTERFSDWLSKESILISFFTSALSPLLPNMGAGLGKSLVLLCDSKQYEDQLCTMDFNNVANLRSIPKLPVYGVCQPTKQGLTSLITYLKNLKHKHLYLVSVREDATVLCNENVYSLRSADHPYSPYTLRGKTGTVLNFLENEIVNIASKGDINKIVPHENFTDIPKFEVPSEAYSETDFVTYLQIPLPRDSSPCILAVEAIQEIVKQVITQSEGEVRPPAIVFCCESGRDRTTTGMSLAGLSFCNAKGYGHGAAKGEEERTAIWNGMYTRGEFKIIQRLVSAMPGGHQSKREVDFILDQCFETSSMMHYHVREEIFVIYNKKEKFRLELARDTDGTGTICVKGPKKGTGLEINVRTYYGQLHKLSLDNLEKYAFLIIYNHYLRHSEVMRGCDNYASFEVWLREVGLNAGLIRMLDEIQFWEFEDACPLQYRLGRNCYLPPSSEAPHGI